MLRETNNSQAPLSYTLSTSTNYVGGQGAFIDPSGITVLGLSDVLLGHRFLGLFLTCYNEDSNYGGGNTTLIRPPCSVELYSGYSKHNYADGYPYHTADAWAAGNAVYIGYDALWHNANMCAGTAAGQVRYGIVEEAPSAALGGTNFPKGLVVWFYQSPVI